MVVTTEIDSVYEFNLSLDHHSIGHLVPAIRYAFEKTFTLIHQMILIIFKFNTK